MDYSIKKCKLFTYIKQKHYFNRMIRDINTNFGKPKSASTNVSAEFGEKRF
jgi:hypothetical protein